MITITLGKIKITIDNDDFEHIQISKNPETGEIHSLVDNGETMEESIDSDSCSSCVCDNLPEVEHIFDNVDERNKYFGGFKLSKYKDAVGKINKVTKSALIKYDTSSRACECPDFCYRSKANDGYECKHMICLLYMLLNVHNSLQLVDDFTKRMIRDSIVYNSSPKYCECCYYVSTLKEASPCDHMKFIENFYREYV